MRVVIAEDLFLLREGLVRLLSAHGFEIVAAVATAPELLTALVDERPDIGIVDVRLPPAHTDDGLRAALRARQQVPGLPVLVLSQYVEQLYARELLADQAGGVGYLLKDRVFNDEAFTAAIRTVAAGGTVLDPEVVAKLMSRRARDAPVARLTPREREVLALMAEGRSNAAIAQRLFVTEKAVSKHAAGIFAKLDLALSDDDNRRVLAVLAYLESLGWTPTCYVPQKPPPASCLPPKAWPCSTPPPGTRRSARSWRSAPTAASPRFTWPPRPAPPASWL